MDEDECPVCFCELASRIRAVAPCRHAVCLQCILRLAPPQTCPICRSDLASLLPTRAALTPRAPLPSPTAEEGGVEDADDVARRLRGHVRRVQLNLALRRGAAPRNAWVAAVAAPEPRP